MGFKFGDYLAKNDISLKNLSKQTGRVPQTIHQDAFVKGVTNKFTAMGYAYALNCEYKELLEGKITQNNRDWEDQCLPNLD